MREAFVFDKFWLNFDILSIFDQELIYRKVVWRMRETMSILMSARKGDRLVMSLAWFSFCPRVFFTLKFLEIVSWIINIQAEVMRNLGYRYYLGKYSRETFFDCFWRALGKIVERVQTGIDRFGVLGLICRALRPLVLCNWYLQVVRYKRYKNIFGTKKNPTRLW